MKRIISILFLICIFLFTSCDILRFSLFEVVSCTPENGYHSEPENIIVSLTFSHEPHRASVERNFSLTGDGNQVRGNFLWGEKSFTFIPLTPLEKNINYTISLSADARDTAGLSMDEAFYCDFTTRAGYNRPVLISCYPSMYAKINDLRTEIKLEFSLPVPINILYETVSFSPSITGFWFLEDEDKTAVFIPSEPWSTNTRYEIRLSSSFTDNNIMNIGSSYTSVFTTGTDRELPYLLHANRITKNGDIFELISDKGFSGAAELPQENSGWEKDDRLSLVFSKPVDCLTLKNYIAVENGPGLILETFPGYETEIIFRFENIPLYESRFTFRIKPRIRDISGNETEDEYIFKIFANGLHSKPPELVGIRIPMAPNNLTDSNPSFYEVNSLYNNIPISEENYPSGEIIKTWIEFYFITAEGASIDIFSLMELFRINTTNNIFTFSPNQVKTSNFSIPEPQSGWEEYQRIEIAGNFSNSTNYGIINIQIDSGLRDNLGNRNEKAFIIPLIK